MVDADYRCACCRTSSVVDLARTRSCPACGVAIDARQAASDSLWVHMPPTVDMAHIQFGHSHVQIEGRTVPVADFSLDRDDSIYFSHRRLVWVDKNVHLETRKDQSGVRQRLRASMPRVMVTATGPGHVALSDNYVGEIVSIPLAAGHGMWARRHVFLGASDTIEYESK